MNDTTQHVLELLERIHELEEERDTLTEVKDALLAVAERFVKERDVALERVRVLEEGEPEPTLFRHLATGGVYKFLGYGTLEAVGAEVVVYESLQDGEIWVRPEAEFFDGRFVEIEAKNA